MKDALLVELLTEELPPRALQALGKEFAAKLAEGLAASRFVDSAAEVEWFATPRRLAALVPQVLDVAPSIQRELQGPSTGAPAQAVQGFAKKAGVPAEALQKMQGPKGEIYVARVQLDGESLDAVLSKKVEAALKALPIPKLMRWGDGEAQFVRPVHGLVMLHGARLVPGAVLGMQSRATTAGHRFLAAAPVRLGEAKGYEQALRDEGKVIARFAARRAEIERQLAAQAKAAGASLGAAEAIAPLLDEVTALVEQPAVYAGHFDAGYLDVPQECLILTMRQNQKYFPLFDAAGKLRPQFLIVSNMPLADPRHIVGGNERVVRPRLEDARFFYDQDRRQRLEARVPLLAKVVHHGKLGTQLERVQRLEALAAHIAGQLGADRALAQRAAHLAKADLLTGMVGEFPELQGIMGRYYALHDGEAPQVADAIEQHYRPRFAGDRLPEGPIAAAVALADKLDTMAGLFRIGEQPTGEKDPFGLRRAALGVVRILVENRLELRLPELLASAFSGHGKGAAPEAFKALQEFVYARFAGYLRDLGYSILQVDAVLCQEPARLHSVPRQLEAVKAFESLAEAESLAAANKRVVNILRQAQAKGESFGRAEERALKEPAERGLFQALQDASAKADRLFDSGDYAGYLRAFAVLKAPVDAFFDAVMVMAEDEGLRRNRLGLLQDLRTAMNRVADLSRLAQ